MEIKFRAWDSKYNEMRKVFKLTFRGSKVVANEDDNLVEIMQYTGLKDKNGKEVYEGDILRYKHIIYTDCSKTEIENIEEESFIEIIAYTKIASVVKSYSKNIKAFGYNISSKECLMLELQSDEIEIVGNIFENPELLEV